MSSVVGDHLHDFSCTNLADFFGFSDCLIDSFYSILFLHPSRVFDVISVQDYVASHTSCMAVILIPSECHHTPFYEVHTLGFLPWHFCSAKGTGYYPLLICISHSDKARELVIELFYKFGSFHRVILLCFLFHLLCHWINHWDWFLCSDIWFVFWSAFCISSGCLYIVWIKFYDSADSSLFFWCD